MRLFIAINLNDETRSNLLALRDELSSRAERGSFSLPENMHLTLAFLGECSPKQASLAKTAIGALSFEPFQMLIERFGNFGRGGREGAIWWAGVRESEPLRSIQRELTDRLTEAGFTLDRRKFSPHITLGRQVVTDTAPRRIEPFGETVSKIDLMKSERIDGKLTYTQIYSKNANDLSS